MMTERKPRLWMVKRQGTEGWGLHHQDEYGNVAQVQPMDAEKGDSINDCRFYFAEYGQWWDLFREPDRVYVKMSWGVA